MRRGRLLAVRWARLFDDLEAQLAAADQDEFAAEVADRSRRELARLHLLDRLRRARGAPVELTVHGAGAISGTLSLVGPGWVLLDIPGQPAALVAATAVISVRGLPMAAVEPTTVGAVESGLDLGFVLRAIARDRSAVTVVGRDGSRAAGTIDRVGADFVDLAEHAPGEPRRTVQVGSVRTLTFEGLAVVRPS